MSKAHENDQVLSVHTLGHETIQLVRTPDGRWSVRNPATDKSTRLAPLEAAVFAASSDESLERHFFSQGGLEDRIATSRLATVAAGLSHGLPTQDYLVALIDSTTLLRADEVLHRKKPTPTRMIDLATTIFALVMNDYVLVPLPLERIPQPLKDIVLPTTQEIDHDTDSVPLQLMGQDPEFLSAIDTAWSAYFGEPVNVDDFWNPVAYAGPSEESDEDRPRFWRTVDGQARDPGFMWAFLQSSGSFMGVSRYFPGSSYDSFLWHTLRGLTQANPGALDTPDFDWSRTKVDRGLFAAFNTVNYFRREMDADAIGAEYHCTSWRFPAERVALARRRRFRWLSDSLLNALSGKQAPPETDDPFMTRVGLPSMLAEVMKQAKTTDQVWDETLVLRHRFTAVREWMRDRANRESGDLQPLAALLNQISRNDRNASIAQARLSQGVSVLSALPHVPTSAGLSLKLLNLLPLASFTRDVIESVTRPEVRILRSYSNEIASLHSTGSDMKRLFKTVIDPEWVASALRLNDVITLDSVKFHTGS